MNFFAKKSVADIMIASEQSSLKRGLRAKDLAALGIGSVVGTGIFVATGQAAHLAGPAVLISFLIAAMTSALCALTYAELSCMFPVSGGSYSYAYVAFGEIVAWMVGWDLSLTYIVSASAVASGWSSTLLGLLNGLGIHIPKTLTMSPLTHGWVDLPAAFISLAITWVLYEGVKESAHINNLIVLLKMVVIGFFIVLGLSHIHFANFHPFTPFGWQGIMNGAAITFFAYIGFDAISTAAEETINPKRNVPLGLIMCLAVVCVLYLLVASALTGMISFKNIDVNNALPAALAHIGIHWGGAFVAVGAIVGMVSTLLITIYGQIRMSMVMSRDGLLPKAFSKIHPIHHTPHICTWITGILTALIAGFFPLPMIIDLCNMGTLLAFIMVSASVIILRKTMPNVERKFRCPWVPYTPIATILFCGYLMFHIHKTIWLNFGIWLLAGLVFYFVYGIKRNKVQQPSISNKVSQAA